MEAKEFEIYKGKQDVWKRRKGVGEYIFNGGVIVGYAPDELFTGQCFIDEG